MYYHFVTGLCDEKETITAREINHLQEPEGSCPEYAEAGLSVRLTRGRRKPNVAA